MQFDLSGLHFIFFMFFGFPGGQPVEDFKIPPGEKVTMQEIVNARRDSPLDLAKGDASKDEPGLTLGYAPPPDLGTHPTLPSRRSSARRERREGSSRGRPLR